MTTKRTTNQLASTPTRIPRTSNSRKDEARRGMGPGYGRSVGSAIQALRDHLAPLHDLQAIGLGLHWDQQTMMPPRGAGARAEALGSVERLHHDAFTSAETGRLIDDAARETEGLGPDAPE